jgi:hypothetical protein
MPLRFARCWRFRGKHGLKGESSALPGTGSFPPPGSCFFLALRRVNLNIERERLQGLHWEREGSNVKATRSRGKGEIQCCDFSLEMRLIFGERGKEGYFAGHDLQRDGVGRNGSLRIWIEDADVNLEQCNRGGAGRDFPNSEVYVFQPDLKRDFFLVHGLRKDVSRFRNEQEHHEKEREEGDRGCNEVSICRDHGTSATSTKDDLTLWLSPRRKPGSSSGRS